MNEYLEFLETKAKTLTISGFDVTELNPMLFPFQSFIVKRALKAGKYAIFADCGLGKTFMQLEWAYRVSLQTGKKVLILAPLAVVKQTQKESKHFNIPLDNIDVSNYEQLDNIDTSIYSGVVLDESSILKNFEGATKQLILDKFANTPYKLACTATPSPNDPMEIGNHSEFLDVMGRNEMLAMYFVHDGGETAKWRLKGHAIETFYKWVGSWAIMLSKPSDIGFEMEGYDLPPLNFIENVITTPKRDNGQLFNDVAISATNFNGELRITLVPRLEAAAEIINNSTDNFIVWVKQNEEGKHLRKLIPDAVELTGSDSLERKSFVSLWFGDHENECKCTSTKEEKRNTNLSITPNITQIINNQLTKPINNGLKSEEKQTQNGENKKTNIVKNTIKATKINTAEHQNKTQNEIESEGSDICQTQNIGSNKSNTLENRQKKETTELIMSCENNMELQSSNTELCLSHKTKDVQFVETNQHSLTHNKDCTLTIATPREKSEGCCVATATKELENLMIAKYCSNVQSCTYCGKHIRKILISKAKMLQFGLNYQNCHNQVFASLDFSFEGLYQAIRRSYRFGQKNEVNIYIITTDTMTNVLEVIKTKEIAFKKMQSELSKTINQNLNMNTSIELIDSEQEVKTDLYHVKRGDCVQKIAEVPSNSIGFSVFSPPFADLYTYSNHIEDMGNSTDYNQFLVQFGYLVKELHRVIMEGRNVAVHCMDLPIQKGKHGFIGLRDFSGLIIKAFTDAGFVYHSRVTIWKDPVVEMQRTKALGLLHKQVKKDSTMSRVGIPDYVLIFRKDGERENPVKCTIDVDTWQKYASPVWMDIKYGNTLQYMSARDEKDEKHICPLQLDTIERLIHLYTNPNDTVLTPFMGIGSEVYQAVKMGRKGIGFELKQSYFDVAVKNCSAAAESLNQTSLF